MQDVGDIGVGAVTLDHGATKGNTDVAYGGLDHPVAVMAVPAAKFALQAFSFAVIGPGWCGVDGLTVRLDDGKRPRGMALFKVCLEFDPR